MLPRKGKRNVSAPPYSAAFRRRFGLANEQALELFHQTISMKSVGNLTSFVREQMLELGVAGGFKIAGAGTHPFSRWEGREEMLAQYRQMAEDAQVVARRILAFGLRVHIGL